jgi:hypothetical protein
MDLGTARSPTRAQAGSDLHGVAPVSAADDAVTRKDKASRHLVRRGSTIVAARWDRPKPETIAASPPDDQPQEVIDSWLRAAGPGRVDEACVCGVRQSVASAGSASESVARCPGLIGRVVHRNRRRAGMGNPPIETT